MGLQFITKETKEESAHSTTLDAQNTFSCSSCASVNRVLFLLVGTRIKVSEQAGR